MPALGINMRIKGNYTETRFDYDGLPTDDIDALLEKAQAAIQAERDGLKLCPIHNATLQRSIRGEIPEEG